MAAVDHILGILTLIISVYLVTSASSDNENDNESTGKPCTFFGGARVSEPQSSLINCSWYSSNACCKRTEVTSVFKSMYPLYAASEACREQVNYMMCYFCSPEQYRWYDKRVRVCPDYCDSIYRDCYSAQFNGSRIGDEYSSGEDFCRGQKFEVSDGVGECFDFDPLVFGCGAYITWHTTVVLASLLAVLHFVHW